MFNSDTPRDAHCCRTLLDVILHGPPSIGFFFRIQLQLIVNSYHGNFEDASDVLDVPFDVGTEAVAVSSDFLGRQHAGEGAHHSSSNSTNDVIQSGGMFFDRVDFVEILYTSVDPVENRLRKTFYMSDSDRPSVSCDGDP